MIHQCLNLKKHGEYIKYPKERLVKIDRNHRIWCLYNFNDVRQLTAIKFCPYCGYKLPELN